MEDTSNLAKALNVKEGETWQFTYNNCVSNFRIINGTLQFYWYDEWTDIKNADTLTYIINHPEEITHGKFSDGELELLKAFMHNGAVYASRDTENQGNCFPKEVFFWTSKPEYHNGVYMNTTQPMLCSVEASMFPAFSHGECILLRDLFPEEDA